MPKFLKNIESCRKYTVSELITVEPGSVESRTCFQSEACSLTFFSFDKGEGISAFAVPGDTLVIMLEGRMLVTINSSMTSPLESGESIIISSEDVYSIDAAESGKMMIIMVKAAE